MPRETERAERGVETAGLAVLVVLLVLLAAGPLLSSHLPAGPGRLLTPPAVSVGSAAASVLWALLIWPLLCRRRAAGSVAATGALLWLVSVPFVAGPALTWGGTPSDLGRAAAVTAGAVLVAGLYLAGPGRRPERDRWFLAGAVLLCFALPIANYGLNEFGGMEGTTGYALSPVLTARAVLLALPGADPAPCLLLMLVVSALLLGLRLRGAGAAALLLLVGAAQAAEVEHLFGGAYVPGRPTPIRVSVDGEGEIVMVDVPGVGTYSAPAAAGGTILAVPAPRDLERIRVRRNDTEWEWVELQLDPVPAGSLLVVSPTGFPTRVAAELLERGIIVVRAFAPPERRDLLSLADGVLDPDAPPESEVERILGGRTPLRRIWEEEDTLLDPDPFWRVFGVPEPWDPERALKACSILVGFGVLALVALRYASGRGLSGGRAALLLLVPSGVALGALFYSVPALPAIRVSQAQVFTETRQVVLNRHEAVRSGVAGSICVGVPVPLGTIPQFFAYKGRDGLWEYAFPQASHEVRLVLAERSWTGGRMPPELSRVTVSRGVVETEAGSAPLAEFLKRREQPDARRAWVIRKLVRLAALGEEHAVTVGFGQRDETALVWIERGR